MNGCFGKFINPHTKLLPRSEKSIWSNRNIHVQKIRIILWATTFSFAKVQSYEDKYYLSKR